PSASSGRSGTSRQPGQPPPSRPPITTTTRTTTSPLAVGKTPRIQQSLPQPATLTHPGTSSILPPLSGGTPKRDARPVLRRCPPQARRRGRPLPEYPGGLPAGAAHRASGVRPPVGRRDAGGRRVPEGPVRPRVRRGDLLHHVPPQAGGEERPHGVHQRRVHA